MQRTIRGYQDFMEVLKENNLEKYTFNSFKDAEKSKMKNSLVIIEDKDSSFFDVYVTAYEKGQFGEYACWVSDEFIEELEFEEVSELLQTVTEFVASVYSSDNIKQSIMDWNSNLYFKTYNN